MVRYVAGGASALLLIAAGFLILRSGADAEDPIPPVPPRAGEYRPLTGPGGAGPPAASEQSRDSKRFARADRDRNGRITLDEQLQPRRKAFAKADRDGNGSLSLEEWTAGTAARFAKADKDKSGWLDPAEYAATKPKVKPRPKCKC
jgi:hypothetical protein